MKKYCNRLFPLLPPPSSTYLSLCGGEKPMSRVSQGDRRGKRRAAGKRKEEELEGRNLSRGGDRERRKGCTDAALSFKGEGEKELR